MRSVSLGRLWGEGLLKLCQVGQLLRSLVMWLGVGGWLLCRRHSQLLKLILEQTQLLQQRRGIQRQAR